MQSLKERSRAIASRWGKAVFFAGALQVFAQLVGCGPAAYAGEAIAAPMEPRVAWSVVERMQTLHEAKVHELEERLRAVEARCVTRNVAASIRPAAPTPRTLQAIADDEYKPPRERAVPIGKLRPDDEDGVSSKKASRSHTSYDRSDRSKAAASRPKAIASRSRHKKHRRRRAPVQQVVYSAQPAVAREQCWSLFSLHVCMPADEDD